MNYRRLGGGVGVVRMANEHLASLFSAATYAEPPAFGDPPPPAPAAPGSGGGLDAIFAAGPSSSVGGGKR